MVRATLLLIEMLTKHEPEAIPYIPILLKDALSLFFRDAESGNCALIESESSNGVVHLVPYGSIFVTFVDLSPLFLHKS